MRCDNIEKERQDQRTPPKQNLRLLFGESFSKLLNQIEDTAANLRILDLVIRPHKFQRLALRHGIMIVLGLRLCERSLTAFFR